MGHVTTDSSAIHPWLLAEDHATHQPFRVRPFGVDAADLDVDFRGTQPPFLVTDVLIRSTTDSNGEEHSEDEIWLWSLPRRLLALLRVTTATVGTHLPLQVNCTRAGCGEWLELDMDLAHLCDAHFRHVAEPCEFAFKPAADAEIRMRLPTGDDQRTWLSHPAVDLGVETLATRLVTQLDHKPVPQDWVVPKSWLNAMGDELQRRDPLMDLELHTRCPNCGEQLAVELDLEATLLGLLAEEQARLLDEVHRLARAYHWSEADIVALPPHRRRHYLKRSEEGVAP